MLGSAIFSEELWIISSTGEILNLNLTTPPISMYARWGWWDLGELPAGVGAAVLTNPGGGQVTGGDGWRCARGGDPTMMFSGDPAVTI